MREAGHRVTSFLIDHRVLVPVPGPFDGASFRPGPRTVSCDTIKEA